LIFIFDFLRFGVSLSLWTRRDGETRGSSKQMNTLISVGILLIDSRKSEELCKNATSAPDINLVLIVFQENYFRRSVPPGLYLLRIASLQLLMIWLIYEILLVI
jgi:hypothetical protein